MVSSGSTFWLTFLLKTPVHIIFTVCAIAKCSNIPTFIVFAHLTHFCFVHLFYLMAPSLLLGNLQVFALSPLVTFYCCPFTNFL